MEPPLLRIVMTRLVLAALPFAVWFAWRAWAKRSGREMGSTPYPWLVAAGAMLVGLSLLASVALQPDNRRERYVPGEVTAGGRVTQGHFVPAPAAPAGPLR
jgi:TRAP-type C4-dicarboxylate transport system permease small subunit